MPQHGPVTAVGDAAASPDDWSFAKGGAASGCEELSHRELRRRASDARVGLQGHACWGARLCEAAGRGCGRGLGGGGGAPPLWRRYHEGANSVEGMDRD